MASADAGDVPPAGGSIDVELAYSPAAGVVDREALRLPAGSRVADALRACAMARRHPAVQAVLGAAADAPALGIWGRRCGVEQALRDGDRVEVYRPLLIDPKDARRERQRRQQALPGRAAATAGESAVKGSRNR